MSTKAPVLLTERERFEGWVEANYGPALLTDDKLGYVYTDIRAAWRAWQARAAIEAEVRTLAAAEQQELQSQAERLRSALAGLFNNSGRADWPDDLYDAAELALKNSARAADAAIR